MRGPDDQTKEMFSYLSPEQRVRADHPLRAIRAMTDRVFADLSPRFSKMYSDIGRPSIPPEQLLRALVLQSLYTVRSERLLMEEIDYSVLYRWFVGLSMDDPSWPATGTAERDAAHLLLDASAPAGSTVGGDKNFDVAAFVAAVRALAITPHVAQKAVGTAIDGRTTRHAGYAISQQKRKLIEQVFGWMKTVGGLRKLRHRGGELVDWIVTFTAAAYNLIRLRTLLARAT